MTQQTQQKIIAPFKKLIVRVPRLNDDGKAFYKDELQGQIYKSAFVVGMSMNDDGNINHIVIRMPNGEVNTLFPHLFINDLVVKELVYESTI